MRLTAYTRGILALPVLKNGSRQAEGGEDVKYYCGSLHQSRDINARAVIAESVYNVS
jgi:hypothetical protein